MTVPTAEYLRTVEWTTTIVNDYRATLNLHSTAVGLTYLARRQPDLWDGELPITPDQAREIIDGGITTARGLLDQYLAGLERDDTRAHGYVDEREVTS